MHLVFFHTMLRYLSWLLPASCTERLTKPKSEAELPSHMQVAKGEDGEDEEGDPTDVLDAECHGGASLLSMHLGWLQAFCWLGVAMHSIDTSISCKVY